MKRLWGKGLLALLLKSASVAAVVTVVSTVSISAQAAAMTEALVQNYIAAMKSSANSQNVNQVARLVSDDALISLSRKGKSTSLDKDAYLKLLQIVGITPLITVMIFLWKHRYYGRSGQSQCHDQ